MIALLVGLALALLVVTIGGLLAAQRLQRSLRRVRIEARQFEAAPRDPRS